MFQPFLFDFAPRVLSISAITGYIRQKFEADLTLQDLWLEGEVSNWKPASSGHIYFTLKDAGASLRCVIWRSQASRLVYLPQREGELVLAHGRMSVYEASGNYQFYVDNLEPVGQGALYAQFERIKARLAAEGLFDPELKKPLPQFPHKIGLVTSPTGAALRDILNVLRRRYPLVQIVLAPAQVQGESAVPQLIAALQAAARQSVEVIILARGGGSLEDLWAFNDERLARAIAACPVPIITGIGHEVDFTIADFVADMRAPTPSAAAELVVPDKLELKRLIYDQQLTLAGSIEQRISAARVNLQGRQWALEHLSPQAVINNYRQHIDTQVGGMQRMFRHRLALQRERVHTLASRLEALNPQATLARGYAIVQKGETVITQTHQVSQGDELMVKVRDGEFKTVVSEIVKG